MKNGHLERFGKGLEKVWKRFGKGLEKVWKGFGKGLEKVWKRFGKGLERFGKGLERFGKGLEKIRERFGNAKPHFPSVLVVEKFGIWRACRFSREKSVIFPKTKLFY